MGRCAGRGQENRGADPRHHGGPQRVLLLFLVSKNRHPPESAHCSCGLRARRPHRIPRRDAKTAAHARAHRGRLQLKTKKPKKNTSPSSGKRSLLMWSQSTAAAPHSMPSRRQDRGPRTGSSGQTSPHANKIAPGWLQNAFSSEIWLRHTELTLDADGH